MAMNKQIPEDVVDQVRKANDIVEVIGEYVQLKKQGRNFFGLCPFHGEKTPSFSVTQDKQIFYCFGCKKGGNIFTFLMELEGMSFSDAVKMLADRSGIELPQFTNERSSMSKKQLDLLAAYDWLAKLYHHILRYTKEGQEAYRYLKERGIDDKSIEVFHLGYAPFMTDFTVQFLEEKGIQRPFLIQSGILRQHADQRITDPFAGRVIFPIRNHLGKVIAFGARAINQQEPKYLNSSESDLFKKNRLLFNFDLAKREIRKEKSVILFEGQMDVIAAYQAGIKNVVATLGTALTDFQAKLLKRYVDTVIICYDGDHAGIEASYKAANLLQQHGCQVKIAQLTDGLDPDGYIQKYGPQSFRQKVIQTSDTYISFMMQYLKKNYNLSLENDLIQYIQAVLREISRLESSVEREYYLRHLSEEYNLSITTLLEDVQQIRKNSNNRQDKRRENRYTKNNTKSTYRVNHKLLPAYQNAERQLIAYMLQDKAITVRVQKEIKASFQVEEHKIIATHLYAFYEDEDTPNVSMFIERLADENIRQLVLEIAMLPIQDDLSDQEINDYIDIIQSQSQEMALIKKYQQEQKLAEKQNDHLKAAQIAMQIIEIEKQLKSK